MATIQDLREYGANVDEGLARCMNNEAFYLRMIGLAVADEGFSRLRPQTESGDLDGAFETAHALKGVLANLALAPILEPVVEITELLRSRRQTDYSDLVQQIEDQHRRLKELLGA